MSSSKELSKYKTKDFDSRMLQPYKMWTADQKRLLDDQKVSIPRTRAEERQSFPQSRRAKTESTMRYNDIYLQVECGEGSIQYYRQDPNGTVSVINVRIISHINLSVIPIENTPYNMCHIIWFM